MRTMSDYFEFMTHRSLNDKTALSQWQSSHEIDGGAQPEESNSITKSKQLAICLNGPEQSQIRSINSNSAVPCGGDTSEFKQCPDLNNGTSRFIPERNYSTAFENNRSLTNIEVCVLKTSNSPVRECDEDSMLLNLEVIVPRPSDCHNFIGASDESHSTIDIDYGEDSGKVGNKITAGEEKINSTPESSEGVPSPNSFSSSSVQGPFASLIPPSIHSPIMMSPKTMRMPILTPRNSPLTFQGKEGSITPSRFQMPEDEVLDEVAEFVPETKSPDAVHRPDTMASSTTLYSSLEKLEYSTWEPPTILKQMIDESVSYSSAAKSMEFLPSLPLLNHTSTLPPLPPSKQISQHPVVNQTSTRNIPIGNRFSDAQRDRTLRHHKLIQPTSSQEKVHLASVRAEQQIEYSSRNNSFSCLSLLTLPEEEEDASLNQEECSVRSNTSSCMYRLDSMESHVGGDVPTMDQVESSLNLSLNITSIDEKPCKSSISSATSVASSSGFTTSDRSNSNISIGESFTSEESPTTTFYVPGENNCRQDKLKASGIISNNFHNSSSAHKLSDYIPPSINSISAVSPSPAYSSPTVFPTCQPCEIESHSSTHRFVICADTQFGITDKNHSWDAEAEYSHQAVDLINQMNPRPSFVCICGDLVDMEYSFEKNKGSKSEFTSTLFERRTGIASREVCDAIQDEQNVDFKKIWSGLHPDIALVCLCGNHDVGNRPTPRSISRFRASFGDEYLAFWTNGTYNIVLNNVLFIDPTGAKRIYNTQLRWLEDRLKYAQDHRAKQIFVFAHHPWFLYDEEEDPESLKGASPYPEEWLPQSPPSPKHSSGPSSPSSSSSVANNASFPDSYFSMPKRYRTHAMELFRKYGVNACFSGHFHQNLISKASWGMDMIITAPLSLVFESTGKELRKEEEELKERKRLQEEELELEAFFLQAPQDESDTEVMEEHELRITSIRRRRKMTYEDEDAMLSSFESSSSGSEQPKEEMNCRGVRVVDVQVKRTSLSSGFSHYFVPLGVDTQ